MEKTILIVDDEQAIRKMFEAAFNNAGYSVTLAESAEEALEILKDNKMHTIRIRNQEPGIRNQESGPARVWKTWQSL